MQKKICIYCSSNTIDQIYFEAADELLQILSKNNVDIVYGGASVGLMGFIANQAQIYGLRVTGVITQELASREIHNTDCDELIITETLSERKAKMAELSDTFITLPGGFGTLDETIEIIKLKELGYHHKQIIIFNINHFFDGFITQLQAIDQASATNQKSENLLTIIEIATEVGDLLSSKSPLPHFEL